MKSEMGVIVDVGMLLLNKEQQQLQNKSSFEQKKRKKRNNQGKKDSNTYQVDEIRSQNDNSSNIYQIDNTIIFVSITTISPLIYSHFSEPSVIVPQLADYISTVYTPQSNSI